MAETVDYEELDKFLRGTSPPKLEEVKEEASYSTLSSFDNSNTVCATTTETTEEVAQEKQGANSYLLALLTPPSPVRLVAEVEHSTQESNISLDNVVIVSSTISLVNSSFKSNMCDSSEMPSGETPNIVMSTSGSCHPIKHNMLPAESTTTTNQNFLSQQTQQQQNAAATLSQLLGHCNNNSATGNVGLDGHHVHPQQQQHLHSQIHQTHQQIQFQNQLQQQQQQQQQQHNLIDSHHHNLPQQLSLAQGQQQHAGQGQSHFSHNPQQFIPFGMNMNPGNFGNGGGPYPFHPHQMPNQQHVHPMMNMNSMHSPCFIPHAAACMQQQQQTFQSYNTNSARDRAASVAASVAAAASVGWMTGPNSQSSSGNAPNCGPRGASCTAPIQMTRTTANVQTPVVSDPTAMPGGLDVLWRELPVECQKLMIPQDIPDTARFRGYFTVCELLQLKRILEARFLGCVKNPNNNGTPITPLSLNMSKTAFPGDVNKEDGKRGTKRGREGKDSKGSPASKQGKGGQKHGSSKTARNGGKNRVTQGDDVEDVSSAAGELMVSLESIKQEQIQTSQPVTGLGVGGVVKEAMEALSSSTDQNGSVENAEKNQGENNEKGNTYETQKTTSEEASASENLNNPDQSGSVQVSHVAAEVEIESEMLDNQKANQVPNSTTPALMPVSQGKDMSRMLTPEIHEVSNVTMSSMEDDQTSFQERQREFSSHNQSNMNQNANLALSSLGVNMVHINSNIPAMLRGNFLDSRYPSPSPPYRTATLVIKLLKIGQYNFRTFSNPNPNKLRVLFNSQRVTYECQLPIFHPTPTEETPNPHPMRKVLTIDIGFDQISMIQFGTDYLMMRVEGAPLLTVSFNPAQEESNPPNISPDNQMLLDQIEKGQLKLSPVHELYLLNERLVQVLESQFREHPKFRHLF